MARLRLRVCDILGQEKVAGSVADVALVELTVQPPGEGAVVRLRNAAGALLSTAALSMGGAVEFDSKAWEGGSPESREFCERLTLVLTTPGSPQFRGEFSAVREIQIEAPVALADQWDIVVISGEGRADHAVRTAFSVWPPLPESPI